MRLLVVGVLCGGTAGLAPADDVRDATIAKRQAEIFAQYNANTALLEVERQEIMGDKNWDRVIKEADKALAVGPSNVAYATRAAAYARKGSVDAALADYTRALEQDSQDLKRLEAWNQEMEGALQDDVVQARAFRANLFVQRADLHVERGDRAMAEADLKAALAVEPASWSIKDKLAKLDSVIAAKLVERRIAAPHSAADFVLRGQALAERGEYSPAVAAFDQAIALDATNAAAYLGRGNARRMGNLAGALEDYDKAVELAPRLPEAYLRRAVLHQDAERWDAVIADASKAIELGGADASLLIIRGTARYHQGDGDAGLSDFQAARAPPGVDSNDRVQALAGEGDALAKLKRPAEAMAAYGAAIAAGKDFMGRIFALPAYIGRGRLHLAAGRREPAEADFKAALAISADYPDAKAGLEAAARIVPRLDGKTAEEWSNLARQQFGQREYAKALESFTHAIELDPRHPMYLGMRGFVHSSQGDDQACAADFERAIALAPNHAPTYALRGNIHQMKGRKDAAIADFRKALQLDPNHAGAQAKLRELGAP